MDIAKTFNQGIKVRFMSLPYGVVGKKPEGMSRDIYQWNMRRHEIVAGSECVISKKQ